MKVSFEYKKECNEDGMPKEIVIHIADANEEDYMDILKFVEGKVEYSGEIGMNKSEMKIERLDEDLNEMECDIEDINDTISDLVKKIDDIHKIIINVVEKRNVEIKELNLKVDILQKELYLANLMNSNKGEKRLKR